MMGGMPLDMSLIFTSAAPAFYDDIATSTSGFMILADAVVMMPLYEGKSFFVYYGFGPVIRYSSWRVKLINKPNSPPVDSQEVGFGAGFAGGAALKLSAKYLLRAEAKYIYEQEKYFGFGAALQFKY
jgi:hypothetical protein